jgi:hypothetical protein
MRRFELLAYVLPLFVFIAPAVYELDSTFRPTPAPTIEVVASVTEWECEEALNDPARVIVVYGPDAKQNLPEADLICATPDTLNPHG